MLALHHLSGRWGALALGVGLATSACSDDAGRDDTPTSAEYDEVATTMGALVAGQDQGEVGAMHDAVGFALGQGDPSLDLDLNGSFVGQRLGLSFSFNVACEDPSGAHITCGDGADSARVLASWDAQWDGDRLDAESSLDADWTLTALGGPVVFLDGTSSASAVVDLTEADGDVRHWSVSYDASYDAVGFDRDHHPVSGRASFSIDANRQVDHDPDKTFISNVEGVVTFTGSGHAVLQLDGSVSYDVNLDTGAVARR